MSEDELIAVDALEYAEPSKDGASVELSFLRKDAPLLVLTIPSARLHEAALSLIAATNKAHVLGGETLDQQIPLAEYVEAFGDLDGQIDLHFQLSATADLAIGLDPRAASLLFEQLALILAGRSSSPTGQTN